MGFKLGFVRCLFLSLVVLSAGCAELNRLREENASLYQNVEELEREKADLADKYTLSEEEKARLIEERDSLERARHDMEGKLRGTGASVRIKDGKIAVVLPSSIFFNSGQATLKKDVKKDLNKICDVIKNDFPAETIRIEGHTDSDPIKKTKDLYASNWELSAMRAVNVLHFLVDESHLDPKRLYIAGFGEYQQVASNKTSKDKKKNRRVEIVVLSNE